ncbi:hypothetical protein NKH18_28510 [Streptomyces sp. M10(2022)]
MALSWISAAFGLLARTPEAAGGFAFFMSFLPYPSSAFVQVESMPGWLHGFAEHQPITPAIESLRGCCSASRWATPVDRAGLGHRGPGGGCGAVGVLFRVRTR